MKNILLTLLLIFSYTFSYSQKKEYEHIVDSLSVKYKKDVIGFSRTITKNPECREIFRIFYTDKGEMQDEIV